MKFRVTTPQEAESSIIYIEADSWFSALQNYLLEQGQEARTNRLKFTVKQDGISATVQDKETGQTWDIDAEIASPDILSLFVSQMRQSYFLLKPYGWLLVLVFFLTAIPTYVALRWLSFPPTIQWIFAWALGSQASLWLWSGLISSVGIAENVGEMHWKAEHLVRQTLLSFACSGGLFGLTHYTTYHTQLSIWWRTAFALLGFSIFLYGLYRFVSFLLIRSELKGWINPGKSRRWIARSMTILILVLGATLFGVFDFIVGMHWWYRTYVTQERVIEVQKRSEILHSLQLKTLHDRKGAYLGLLARSESDWSRYYNQSQLLSWKISQTIQWSEGAVPPPAWWWVYLPDGDSLLSEPFSLKAFFRVPYYFLKQRRKVGGSTPALQAAKNFMDFGLKRRRKSLLDTIGMKLFVEIPRAYIMAQRFTPREMMATYMSTLWAGRGGNYGLHRMSLYYFNVENPAHLNWNQAAVLAASLPNPGRFNPWYLAQCRRNACQNKRRAKVWKVWKERIRQVKQKIRRRGHTVSSKLPPFSNGLSRLRTLSRKWLKHDAHIRSWIRKELPQTIPDWNQSSKFQLSYDRTLTLGRSKLKRLSKTARQTRTSSTQAQTQRPTLSTQKTPKASYSKASSPSSRKDSQKTLKTQENQRGLVGFIRAKLKEYRHYIPDLQIAYTLVDAQKGQIVSQYGGDGHVDMALAKKPVVGSVFKVLTLFIGKYWPDRLPLINQGRNPKKRIRRLFTYQPQAGVRGHYVRNSHGMVKFVNKRSALAMSANIGFVFLSLRWTWLLDRTQSKEVIRIGLEHMYRQRLRLSPQAARKRAHQAMSDPAFWLRDLKGKLGYRSYLKRWQTRALFEAGKGSAIQELIRKRTVSPRTLTLFLDSDSLKGFGRRIQSRWSHYRFGYARKWKEQRDWEWISWIRPLRMELGLRYIMYLGQQIAQMGERRDYLKPVMTMTLGVNNADTRQLAALSSTVAANRIVHPKIIRTIYRGNRIRYAQKQVRSSLILPKGTIQDIQKAMHAVIRWGTATRAGRLVLRKHGSALFKRSGAKTGTVQRSRGVSCIGYIGHRAGALTISTPHNRPLVKYMLYTSLQNVTKQLQGKVQSFHQCMLKNPDTTSSKHRYCKRKHTYWKERTERYQKKLAYYTQQAERYVRVQKIWKRSLRKAARFERKAKILAQRMAFKRRQVGIYQKYAAGDRRMIQLYERWMKTFDDRNQRKLKASKTKAIATHTLRVQAQKQEARFIQELEQIKHVLRLKKPHRTRSSIHKREWRKLVRTLQKIRYNIKKASYLKRIRIARDKTVRHRIQRYIRLIRTKTKQYHAQNKRMQNNQKRLERWKKKALEVEGSILVLQKGRQATLEQQKKWLQQAAREEADYNRLEALVKRTHKRWKLYSSDACWLLFSLLSQWTQSDS